MDVSKVIYLKFIYLVRLERNPDMWSNGQVYISLCAKFQSIPTGSRLLLTITLFWTVVYSGKQMLFVNNQITS